MAPPLAARHRSLWGLCPVSDPLQTRHANALRLRLKNVTGAWSGELTTIPPEEWDQAVADSAEFWNEMAAISPRAGRVVQNCKDYSAMMEEARVPCRYS